MSNFGVELIAAIRGGIPACCDFCNRPYGEEREPVPEEAGAWACTECFAEWEKQDLSPEETAPCP